jgi:hypothetical protein
VASPPPPVVHLEGIWLRPLDQRFPNQDVPLDVNGIGTVNLPGGTVLPAARLYSLEATASAAVYTIETQQLDLQGTVGRGWTVPTAMAHWQSPVIAVDVLALTQANLALTQATLNRIVLGLTIAVTVLGVLQFAATLYPWCPLPSIGPASNSTVPALSASPPARTGTGKANTGPRPQDPRR